MDSLFFPKLLPGALSQYPIRKNISTRNVRNILPDGSLVLYPDPDANHIIWELAYQDLTPEEIGALTGLFAACQGRVRSFTFIDPTDNMLLQSGNLCVSPWSASPGLTIAGNAPDPIGGFGAFVLTNNAQTTVQLSQSVMVPTSYQYCFTIYASSLQTATVSLLRAGSLTEQSETFQTSDRWSRITSSGVLPDGGTGLTVAVSIAPGTRVNLFGPQLEAQIVPSRYRPTLNQSAIYPDAHWGVDALPVSADAPNLFSTAFTIEAMTGLL